mmetsp:Transcript_46135/g.113193  ORF Transcript_46135/g.113193 Transcript_46135/m.113193 type:complete len:356 (-) Transcript_46135:151-1218(-)|eukprot:CAMPEP_0198334580 /NCGR_PEP_ID=MMETSP1450-20131203/19717_1 /TAXON_ID=753684 ORGANISM="Madagascaria erythrocladiodes, Strain CCMP3234" /NCGR_SAMPLE_ID=MMETSP1450 /ASSEMBLY_ACC=CAM_ASM_001115 /LENGTH=355 /DNA_ID=CAMNT_0044039183 /DNA_START=120 /DNA_END=1187 /DNA_ORIENTATION=-
MPGTEDVSLIIDRPDSYNGMSAPSTIRDLYKFYNARLGHTASGHVDASEEDDSTWVYHILTSQARVIPKTMITVSVVLALIVVLLNRFIPSLYIGMATLGMFAIPVGFLLGWRTTVSYGRWWEGRNTWTVIETCAVDLGVFASTCCADKDPELGLELVRAVAAFVFAERNSIQDPSVLDKEDPNHVWETTLLGSQWDRTCAHKSDYVIVTIQKLRRLALRVSQVVAPMAFMSVDQKNGMLLTCVKKVHLLQNQPMPESFVVLLRTLLLLYVSLVPFITVKAMSGSACIAFQFVTAFALLSVEAAAAELERPFDNTHNDVPVNAIVLRIAQTLADLEDDILASMGKKDDRKGAGRG